MDEDEERALWQARRCPRLEDAAAAVMPPGLVTIKAPVCASSMLTCP